VRKGACEDLCGGTPERAFPTANGNLALYQIAGRTQWSKNRALNEPTLNNELPDKVFKGWQGTSFAAPHVTHIAARLQHSLREQLKEEPSANLIRALLASSAKYVQYDWLDSVVPLDFTEKTKQKHKGRLRLSGFGKVDYTTLITDRNHVTLFAEDSLDLKKIHIYKIPVPLDFLKLKTTKRIAIGFAYNPPTRLSRKEYIVNSLWFEVFRKTDIESVLQYKGKKERTDNASAEAIMKNISKKSVANSFSPGYTIVRNSTLQQRVWEKGVGGGSDLIGNDNNPFIYILVTGKAKFSLPDELKPQPYALAITFSYESKDDIQLQQKLSEQVKIKHREQVKIKTHLEVRSK
jgi:hypothetical protein